MRRPDIGRSALSAGAGRRHTPTVLARGRPVASTLGFRPEHADGRDITVTSVMANPGPATLERLAEATASDAVRVPISDTYPLDAVAQALGAFSTGTIGKIAITVD